MIGIVPSANMRRSLEESLVAYEAQLPGSPGQTYLSERGITKQTQVFFRLGYVEEPLLGDESYQGRIVIPYMTLAGVVSIRYRATGDGEYKYLTRPGDIPRPFNVSALHQDTDTVYITEGEMDAIVASMIGLAAVGFPGNQMWKPAFARLFRFRRVVVLADGDQQGKDFASKVAASIDGCRIVSMPAQEDVNSILSSDGPEGLREIIGIG